MPAILHAKELIEAYPNAKVILTTRDINSWYNSVSTTIDARCKNYTRRFLELFHPSTFFYIGIYQSWDAFFRGSFAKNGRIVFEEYNAMIRGLVPKERLLEYHVSQGWGPLCEFLGKEAPKVEMPNGNFGTDFTDKCERIQRQILEEAKWNMIRFFVFAALFVAIMTGWVAKGTLFGALDLVRS
jgi:hypothetical protein